MLVDVVNENICIMDKIDPHFSRVFFQVHDIVKTTIRDIRIGSIRMSGTLKKLEEHIKFVECAEKEKIKHLQHLHRLKVEFSELLESWQQEIDRCESLCSDFNENVPSYIPSHLQNVYSIDFPSLVKKISEEVDAEMNSP